jgi:hypothetical protein
MGTIYFDFSGTEEARRGSLYNGDLHLLQPSEGLDGLAQLASRLAEEAFAPNDPEFAHESMDVKSYVEVLADLKPRFIHHPDAKVLIRQLLTDAGCDVDKTYFDVPRLRTMVCGDYLKAGLALQFHPHRDTWFSAPLQQLNWWLPVYDVAPENTLAFHPSYFGRLVPNSSCEYDYGRWVQTGRQHAATITKTETRAQPRPLEPIDPSSETRVVPPAHGAIIFSAAQLHATVPNTSARTRFSVDFRTVNVVDLAEGVGAPNIDSACTGTTLRDFIRASDLAPLPEAIIAAYEQARAPSWVGP